MGLATCVAPYAAGGKTHSFSGDDDPGGLKLRSGSIACSGGFVKAYPPVPSNITPPVSDQIESVATSSRFAGTYAGDVLGQDGVVTVYVTSGGRSAMASALSDTGIPAGAYRLVPVAHSLTDLQNITTQIASDQSTLEAQGVHLVMWGPDAVSNRVVVQTTTSSTSAAPQILESRYGGPSWITVQPTTAPAKGQLDSNRYYDNPPFWSGDRIFDYYITVECTSGFGLVGNASGNYFNTTAGHCGEDGLNSVYTNFIARYHVGDVSTNYITNGDELDVESFLCNCGIYVWYDSPSIGTSQGSTHTVVGWCDCDSGNYVAFDGATTGESAGALVNQYNNWCVSGNYWSDGRTRCYMNGASKGSSTSTICNAGDSGGPVYQRAANNTAYVTGTIIGTFENWCWYSRMDRILYQLNVSLLKG